MERINIKGFQKLDFKINIEKHPKGQGNLLALPGGNYSCHKPFLHFCLEYFYQEKNYHLISSEESMVDFPNFFNIPVPERELCEVFNADKIIEPILEQLKEYSNVLVSFSRGTRQAYYLAKKYPNLFSSVIIISGSFGKDWHKLSQLEIPYYICMGNKDPRFEEAVNYMRSIDLVFKDADHSLQTESLNQDLENLKVYVNWLREISKNP